MKIWSAEPGTGIPYYDVDWREPCALIIGSEAHGPSDDLRRIADAETFIPVSKRVESLNAAIAASVLLFEIARQRGTR
jgi:TrmH family RNA methyltransferase